MICELSNANLSALVDPEDGMNVLSLKYFSKECVYVDERKRAERIKTYGIPILFPTPNRTRDWEYESEGRKIPATMHGFLKHDAFEVVEQGKAFITGRKILDGSQPMFPYRASVTVTIRLENDGLHHEVCVENMGTERFGYGLALHPFFVKKENSTFSCNVEEKMLASEEKLPTGETVPVKGTDFDYNEPSSVSELEIDTVFICSGSMECRYTTPTYVLSISCSDAYDHVVLYTTKAAQFICFEPQTCSTDLFNMEKKGFSDVAKVLKLEAGKRAVHTVDFCFSSRC